MRRRYRARFADVLEPVSHHERDPAGNRWPTVDEVEDLLGFLLWKPGARTFAYLIITEYRERGFLAEHVRDLATTGHAPGRIIRIPPPTETGNTA